MTPSTPTSSVAGTSRWRARGCSAPRHGRARAGRELYTALLREVQPEHVEVADPDVGERVGRDARALGRQHFGQQQRKARSAGVHSASRAAAARCSPAGSTRRSRAAGSDAIRVVEDGGKDHRVYTHIVVEVVGAHRDEPPRARSERQLRRGAKVAEVSWDAAQKWIERAPRGGHGSAAEKEVVGRATRTPRGRRADVDCGRQGVGGATGCRKLRKRLFSHSQTC